MHIQVAKRTVYVLRELRGEYCKTRLALFSNANHMVKWKIISPALRDAGKGEILWQFVNGAVVFMMTYYGCDGFCSNKCRGEYNNMADDFLEVKEHFEAFSQKRDGAVKDLSCFLEQISPKCEEMADEREKLKKSTGLAMRKNSTY